MSDKIALILLYSNQGVNTLVTGVPEMGLERLNSLQADGEVISKTLFDNPTAMQALLAVADIETVEPKVALPYLVMDRDRAVACTGGTAALLHRAGSGPIILLYTSSDKTASIFDRIVYRGDGIYATGELTPIKGTPYYARQYRYIDDITAEQRKSLPAQYLRNAQVLRAVSALTATDRPTEDDIVEELIYRHGITRDTALALIEQARVDGVISPSDPEE